MPAMQLTAEQILALLPLGAAMSTGVRLLLGVRSIGTFAPALLALAAIEVGHGALLVCLLIAASAAVAASPVIDRLTLARSSRLGLLIVAIATALVGSGAISQGGSALPLVVVAIVCERTWESARVEGPRKALQLFATTVAIAATIALALTALSPHLLGRHWLTSAAIGAVATIAVGSYRGLRLSELARFRTILRPSPVHAGEVRHAVSR